MARRYAKYADARSAVRRVVNGADPMALLAGGAPEDEYDQEVDDLVRLVLHRDPPTAEAVDATWRRSFGDDNGLGQTAEAIATELRTIQHRLR